MKTWVDTIKKDVEAMSGPVLHGLKRWNSSWMEITSDIARDRVAWRAAVRDTVSRPNR